MFHCYVSLPECCSFKFCWIFAENFGINVKWLQFDEEIIFNWRFWSPTQGITSYAWITKLYSYLPMVWTGYYCWWFRNPAFTTWDVSNLVNKVGQTSNLNWCRISSINSSAIKFRSKIQVAQYFCHSTVAVALIYVCIFLGFLVPMENSWKFVVTTGWYTHLGNPPSNIWARSFRSISSGKRHLPHTLSANIVFPTFDECAKNFSLKKSLVTPRKSC